MGPAVAATLCAVGEPVGRRRRIAAPERRGRAAHCGRLSHRRCRATRSPTSSVSARSVRARSGRPPRFPKSARRQRLSRRCSPTALATNRCGHPASSRLRRTLTGAAASYAEGVRRLLAVQDRASTAFAAAVAEDPQPCTRARRAGDDRHRTARPGRRPRRRHRPSRPCACGAGARQ